MSSEMDEENINLAVMKYLRKKGFKNSERAFRSEAKTDTNDLSVPESDIDSAVNQIHLHNTMATLDYTPDSYFEGYSKLRDWVHSSLDLYKNELMTVLHPVFVHTYMELIGRGYSQEAKSFFSTFREDHEYTHGHDIQKLDGLSLPQHLQENETANSLLHNKITVRLCQYSLELLLHFLHGSGLLLMLSLVNDHVNLNVFVGQPGNGEDDNDGIGIVTGTPSCLVRKMNETNIRWGALEDSIEHRFEKEATRGVDMGATDITEDQNGDPEAKKRGTDSSKGPPTAKRAKKDKTGGAAPSERPAGLPGLANGSRTKSAIPLPSIPDETEKAIFEDLRNRVRVSSQDLPSIHFYTLTNCQNSLNCTAISPDGSLVAGGFCDSSVKLWDMKKPDPDTGADVAPFVQPIYGHSGPIHSVDFSVDSKFLLSSSSDSSVRLWSREVGGNLVCYRAHMSPVWDCKFSPLGHYFATASQDRTAMVWSMDRARPLRIMAGHLSDVDTVEWHVNCNYMATGSSDKTVRLWDVATGTCCRIFSGHKGSVLSLALSSDGRFMASGDEDGAIIMWDLGSGRKVTPLMGHTGCIWSLAFSGESSLLASGSSDCTVRIWDVSASAKAPIKLDDNASPSWTQRLRLTKVFPTKSTPVYTLRFSRRNLLFASGAICPPKGKRRVGEGQLLQPKKKAKDESIGRRR